MDANISVKGTKMVACISPLHIKEVSAEGFTTVKKPITLQYLSVLNTGEMLIE